MCDSRRQPAILTIGQDRRLLESRAAVIRTAFRCVTACDLNNLEYLPDEQFDLVVICHTVLGSEYEACATYVRNRWKDAYIVRISGGLLKHVDKPELAVSSQPLALLQALELLLCRSPSATPLARGIGLDRNVPC
jgi:hypothetical protein